MDLNAQYCKVVRKLLSKEAIVAGHFHMLKNHSGQMLGKVWYVMAPKWGQCRGIVRASGLPELVSFAGNKGKSREEIIAHEEHPFCWGLIGDCLNKIKGLKRVAFGFRGWNHFSMRILYCFLSHKTRRGVPAPLFQDSTLVQNISFSPNDHEENCRCGFITHFLRDASEGNRLGGGASDMCQFPNFVPLKRLKVGRKSFSA